MKKITYSLVAIFSAVYFSACGDVDETYKEFVVPNGITYPQKAEALTVLEGRNRVRLQWLKGTDPKVVKAQVYWNNYTDSVNVDIAATDNIVSVDINNLSEDTYTFFVKTYDADGNVSVPVEVIGQAYGANYQSTLSSRAFIKFDFFPDRAELTWGPANPAAVSFVIKYLDSSGNPQEETVPADALLTSLTDYQIGSEFTTETRYRPTTRAIDTFLVTDVNSFPTELPLTKSSWANAALPGDSWLGAGGATGDWSFEKLWDGLEAPSNANRSYASAGASPIPQHFTIDLGYKASLSRMQLWPNNSSTNADRYQWMSPREFELWGSNNPDPDGGWVNWVKLGEWTVHKPSGYELDGSVGTVTADDEDYFRYHQVYDIVPSAATPNAADPVRYIRFKTINNFATYITPAANDYVAIAEMSLWGAYRD
ncbi:hypothetical protein SAMD00024442_29_6 [Candidatus Symbiothrix dinenymphae]|nr:hypothetical protein SAMD00024442_29_6 [Candidatus Symbiothrix dinenymphae]